MPRESAPAAAHTADIAVVPAGDHAPAWLDAPAVPGTTRDLLLRSRALGELRIPVWAPAGTEHDEPLPLLVAHDGPTYDEVSRLTRFAGAMIHAERLPPHRVALLSAPDRDEWYAASARYARALASDILPALRAVTPVAGAPAGIGASLGALAMLHAEHRRPGLFAGLLLQSGSFFMPRFDAHESGFRRYERIVAFVGRATRSTAPEHAPPLVLTAGRDEENLHNNRATARALRARGWKAELYEVRGGHDHLAWRDALDPHLTRLLAGVWRTV